jgi:hypothetical protein
MITFPVYEVRTSGSEHDFKPHVFRFAALSDTDAAKNAPLLIDARYGHCSGAIKCHPTLRTSDPKFREYLRTAP